MSVIVFPAASYAQQRTLKLLHDKRILLIFAERGNDPQLQRQLEYLKDGSKDVEERDLVGVALPLDGAASGKVTFSSEEARSLRRKFKIGDEDFTVILIGKDGGEKLRRHAPIPVQRLDEVIDAMPMRQEEMKRNNPPS